MRDMILELPSDGETLLREVKLTRPTTKAFRDYWNAQGRGWPCP